MVKHIAKLETEYIQGATGADGADAVGEDILELDLNRTYFVTGRVPPSGTISGVKFYALNTQTSGTTITTSAAIYSPWVWGQDSTSIVKSTAEGSVNIVNPTPQEQNQMNSYEITFGTPFTAPAGQLVYIAVRVNNAGIQMLGQDGAQNGSQSIRFFLAESSFPSNFLASGRQNWNNGFLIFVF